jgi:hypothetical protein
MHVQFCVNGLSKLKNISNTVKFCKHEFIARLQYLNQDTCHSFDWMLLIGSHLCNLEFLKAAKWGWRKCIKQTLKKGETVKIML